MPKVLITSDNSMGSTLVGVNGVNVRVPHNQEVEISHGHLGALQNASLSRATLQVLDDGVDTSAEAEVLTTGAASPTLAPEMRQDPATPAETGAGTVGTSQERAVAAEAKPDATDEPAELRQDPATPAEQSSEAVKQSLQESKQDTSQDSSAPTRARKATTEAATPAETKTAAKKPAAKKPAAAKAPAKAK